MSKKVLQRSPVAARLREARVRKGISQKQLGILAGIDRFSASARINQYERDKHVPDYTTAKRLAENLDVSVSFFYAEDDRLAKLILKFEAMGTNKRSQLLRLLDDM